LIEMRIGIRYLCEITYDVVRFILDLKSGNVGLKDREGFDIQMLMSMDESPAETYLAKGKMDDVEFDLYVLKTGVDLSGLQYVVSGQLYIAGVECDLEDIIFANGDKLYVLSDADGELHCGMIVDKGRKEDE
jgi:hypothetical protein